MTILKITPLAFSITKDKGLALFELLVGLSISALTALMIVSAIHQEAHWLVILRQKAYVEQQSNRLFALIEQEIRQTESFSFLKTLEVREKSISLIQPLSELIFFVDNNRHYPRSSYTLCLSQASKWVSLKNKPLLFVGLSIDGAALIKGQIKKTRANNTKQQCPYKANFRLHANQLISVNKNHSGIQLHGKDILNKLRAVIPVKDYFKIEVDATSHSLRHHSLHSTENQAIAYNISNIVFNKTGRNTIDISFEITIKGNKTVRRQSAIALKSASESGKLLELLL